MNFTEEQDKKQKIEEEQRSGWMPDHWMSKIYSIYLFYFNFIFIFLIFFIFFYFLFLFYFNLKFTSLFNNGAIDK